MAAEDIAVIVNPGANRGRAHRMVERMEEILRKRNVPHRVIQTARYEEIEERAREAREEGFPTIVSCGGDGTHRAVASALAGTGTKMGLVCGGRGNDLARALGIPLNTDAAIDTILAHHTRTIDVGVAGDRVFLTVATLGIDSEVSEKVIHGQRGPLAAFSYPLGLLRTLFTYRPPKVTLKGDFGIREERVLLAATANTSYYGKGMMIAPGADPADGEFEVCVIRALPRVKLLGLYPTVYRGSHGRFDEVELLRTKSLLLESDQTLSLYADGEYLGETPIDLEVRPRALRVCVPGGTGT
jgi:YegS/Rv2252/BmrU family lipid kinase